MAAPPTPPPMTTARAWDLTPRSENEGPERPAPHRNLDCRRFGRRDHLGVRHVALSKQVVHGADDYDQTDGGLKDRDVAQETGKVDVGQRAQGRVARCPRPEIV